APWRGCGEPVGFPSEDPRIGGNSGSGSATNGSLGNMYQPFDLLKPANGIHLDAVSISCAVSIGDGRGDIILDGAGQHVGDKRGFAGTRNTRDGGELAKWNVKVLVNNGARCDSGQLEHACCRPSRYLVEHQRGRIEIVCRNGLCDISQPGCWTRIDNMPTVDTGLGANVNHPVGL